MFLYKLFLSFFFHQEDEHISKRPADFTTPVIQAQDPTQRKRPRQHLQKTKTKTIFAKDLPTSLPPRNSILRLKTKTMTKTKTNTKTMAKTNTFREHLHRTTQRLLTFETFDQSDEET